jgi:hypothetical protein
MDKPQLLHEMKLITLSKKLNIFLIKQRNGIHQRVQKSHLRLDSLEVKLIENSQFDLEPIAMEVEVYLEKYFLEHLLNLKCNSSISMKG